MLFQSTPPQLEALIERLTAEVATHSSETAAFIRERNREEPWRAAAYLMRAKVLLAIEHPGSPAAYASPEQLEGDLTIFADMLEAVGAHALVSEFIVPFRRQLAAFGFHSAALDVRQNSAFHEKALSQLLAVAGVPDGAPFSEWKVEAKRELLERELASPRPFLAPGMSAGPEADTVLASHRVLAEHRAKHGNAGLGALIVSMTRRAEDLLIVYLLAREAGLMEFSSEGLVCPLPVTPLFETMADLEAGPGIVSEFLHIPSRNAASERKRRSR